MIRRRITACLLALALFLGFFALQCPASAISRTRAYRTGVFSDVKETDWFVQGVKTSFECGLMNGSGANRFRPTGILSVAEALAIACRLHSAYAMNRRTFPQGNPWYRIYVEYAVSNKIMSPGQFEPTKMITREQFAYLMSGAIPDDLPVINTITAIPDVRETSAYGASVYRLYRAGILTGSDSYGTFKPTANIQRSEAATITARLADRSLRRTFTLLTPGTQNAARIAVTGIQTAGKTRIAVGETTTWTAKALPEGAQTTFSWTAGNPGVATVDQNGRITGHKAGQCNITIWASKTVRKTVLLTVGEDASVTGIYIAGKTRIAVGETTAWTAKALPEGAQTTFSWTAGNPGVATVDQNGRITGHKAGQCNITIWASKTVRKTVLLTVGEDASVTGIYITGKTRIAVGETTAWTATVVPANAKNQRLVWTAGNPGVATVDQNGRITGRKAGLCNITVTAANGVKSTVLLTVGEVAVTGINTSGKTQLREGERTKWTAAVVPANATDKRISWTAGNPNVATVTQNGEITAHCAGQCNITMTAANGVTKTVLLTVTPYDTQTSSAVIGVTNNTNAYYESCSRWSYTVDSYLLDPGDGQIRVLRSVNGETGKLLRVDTYNADYQLLNSVTLPAELPLFGGFYAGRNCYYAAYGQENREENNSKEVIRVVKYDKNFNRLASASIRDCYTISPFDAGSLRMAESGNELAVHTARLRYKTEDGRNHQSQLTFYLDTSNMTLKTNDTLGKFQGNHVSHSFNQFVKYDNGVPVLLDHGDAYPRSVVVHRRNNKRKSSYSEVDLLTIPGSIGANCTGVGIGGFEISDSSYLAAINMIDFSKATGFDSYNIFGIEREERDAVVLACEKNRFDSKSVSRIRLTNHSGRLRSAGVPKLVALPNGQYMVLWEEYDLTNNGSSDDGVFYCVVDGRGNRVTQNQQLRNARLSDCQPIVRNNAIVWFADVYKFGDGMSRSFYQIDLS